MPSRAKAGGRGKGIGRPRVAEPAAPPPVTVEAPRVEIQLPVVDETKGLAKALADDAVNRVQAQEYRADGNFSALRCMGRWM